MNYIFEGCDNTYKTTTLNALQKRLIRGNKRTMRINSSGIDSVHLTNQYYADMAFVLNGLPEVSFLIDRAWIGEEVYGPIYRKRNPAEIREINRTIEKELYVPTTLVYLYDDAESLIARDDGLSLTIELAKKRQELKTFENAVDASLLDKIKVNVHGKTTDEIVEEIFRG